MSPVMLRKIANFVWFQSIWLLVIVYQYEWLWLVGLLLIGFFFITDDRLADGIVMATVGLTGVIIDSLLTLSGVFGFTAYGLDSVIPLWLMALWLAFAGTLRHSLRYFMGNWPLCAVAGAVFGPLSYYAGYKLEAVAFGYSLAMTLVILSVIWAIVLPLAFWLTSQVETRRHSSTGK